MAEFRAKGLGTDRSPAFNEPRCADLLTRLGTVLVQHGMALRHCWMHRGYQLLAQEGKRPPWARGPFAREGAVCSDTLLDLAVFIEDQHRGALLSQPAAGAPELGAAETFAELSILLKQLAIRGVGKGVLIGDPLPEGGCRFELRRHDWTVFATGPTLQALAAAAARAASAPAKPPTRWLA